ncbi:MAG: mannose-1-phosphate guanylyltransferase [Treponema sp.]|nr:mannose-1-phosphate guanylyltransferase [Treponema sp.]
MPEPQFTDVVILAGGFGERLWPASSPEFPKQFLSLPDGNSFLQEAVLRALAIEPPGKILVISRPEICGTLTSQISSLKDRLSEQQKEKIQNDVYVIAEPCPRHTCAPLLLACKLLRLADSQDHTILVLASDHVIFPDSQFSADCKKAAGFAEKGKFVCFAIPPSEPSTGYGYISMGKCLDSGQSVFEISHFKEKPDLETAQRYIASGTYSWNSGMFGFTASFFESEIKKYEPEMHIIFSGMDSAKLPGESRLNSILYIENWEPLNRAYKSVKSIAVDNAIAERTDSAVAVKASFTWDDVGSWDSFEKYFTEDAKNCVSVESSGNFVYSDIPAVLCGVTGLIVAVKNGRLLVMKKGTSGSMREAVKKFKELNPKTE